MFLDQQFKIKDLGTLHFFLGLEVTRSQKDIVLNQRKYALELVSDAGLLAVKPMSSPMDSSIRLAHDQGSPLADAASYRRLIGRLLYLTTTHHDISFAVHHLSQFGSKPIDIHLSAAHRVLHYLKGSLGHGLFFPSSSNLHFRFVTGFCLFIGSSLVSWKSKNKLLYHILHPKQSTVM
ncbi:uncharacterized mitochondrial protein AtMg00810-like [Gastrolobium bilobum]|uniref:uncharacterized mitochondrial protein AtMg00810-like n=1 Tax=Gastrolobium bilobum TaxID=150636 RepID=UPI002AB0116F|nr:uncharacterized mitochondrial protein AtMg00810-like [Gastrolobium bilobum]